MYLSHPVRRIREDPDKSETITLRVTAVDDEAADELADCIDEFGVVEERLRFAGLRVTLPQVNVEEVCTLEGIESIETGNTVSMDFDTPEDADYDSTCR
ncbi:hypothetical protein [Salinibaculum rarum]|uniref:hypothetical protein n=1 Tax=Salinibaculum rarum TaxID=3058903 RepID=UPI0026604D3F|nr:hypothetical protein [Salinibaculum sp. KK48]